MPDVPRISASSYSNTAPLIWSFLYGANRGKYELILDNAPARSAELLAQNRIDAALVPVIEYQRIPDVLLVPDVCVGARERVRSVCLVTKGEDLKDVRSVALDVSSKTSVALTKIVFREFLGFEPVYTDARPNARRMLAEADCALLIGDPALVISDFGFRISDSAEGEEPLRKFDLAETWKSFTGCGFVFAMWMTHRAKAATARAIDFAAARDEGLAHADEIISNYETEIALGRDDFRRYLTENISYTIDDSMRKGLELYHQLAYRNGLCETHKALEFI
ncbi:MAG: menaquinone biosynthesis protein [Acidobacteria bacterium]|nr:menaquinone biosynthesis protein [Acidobacteriota bacterium]